MKQNKYIEEIEELNTADVSQNERLRRKQNNRKIIKSVFILFLSVLCVTGLVLIHKLHIDARSNSEPRVRFSRMTAPKMPSANTSNMVNSFANGMAESIEAPKPFQIEKETPAVLNDLSARTEAVLSLSETDKEIAKTEKASSSLPLKTEKEQLKSDYTLKEALLFKEHFLKGDSCESDYQRLIQATHKTSQMKTVLNNLSMYCIGKTLTLQKMRETFLKDKKKALIAEYRQKGPYWVAAVKALLVSVVEIRKLHPTTSRPKDILYKAQNELYRQNIGQADRLLRTLPIVMQEAMADFFREAGLYSRADESLSELIMSFEQKGE